MENSMYNLTFFLFQNHHGNKKKLEKQFYSLLQTNQRYCHVRGPIKYISNIEPSANDFKSLRGLIYKIAKKMPGWGEDYPIRWINLERELEGLRKKKDKSVFSLEYIKEIAKNGSFPITSTQEVIFFLQYQHQLGNIIFFNETSLYEFVIIKPTWLIDAFRCIVFANELHPFAKTPLNKILLDFKKTGEITLDLLKKLVRKKHPELIEHFIYVLDLMMKFDIIVRLEHVEDTLVKNVFICPCVIDKQSYSFEQILNENDKCVRSPWLCLEFNFLPPALFNHLLVFCMRDLAFARPKLCYEFGLFCLKKTNGMTRFVLCMSKNTIFLQIMSSKKDDNSSVQRNENMQIGQTLFKNISRKINDILHKYEQTVNYKLIVQCPKSDYAACETEGHSYSVEHMKYDTKATCDYHDDLHDIGEMFTFWIPVSSIVTQLQHIIAMYQDNLIENKENVVSNPHLLSAIFRLSAKKISSAYVTSSGIVAFLYNRTQSAHIS